MHASQRWSRCTMTKLPASMFTANDTKQNQSLLTNLDDGVMTPTTDLQHCFNTQSYHLEAKPQKMKRSVGAQRQQTNHQHDPAVEGDWEIKLNTKTLQ